MDDEPMILQGLDRMLRSMRKEWDMSFIDSGLKALGMMENHSFDVVVSDMRMPGMNGAQLLKEVMDKYPKTIRFILSGHADQEMIIDSLGSTHQYLTKPCSPQSLKAAILRVTTTESSWDNEPLKKLVTRMDRLPSFPSVYGKMVEAIESPDVDLEKVGAIIAQDLGMTSKILKLVNSAFFGLPRQISSPTEAICYLGLDAVKSLVLVAGVFSQYEESKMGDFSMPKLWTHSLKTAAASKAIAITHHSELGQEGFTAGMLHDAGKLVMASSLPDSYNEVLRTHSKSNPDWRSSEREVFGVDHGSVGGYLFGLWGLPVSVVDAIALHHQPCQSAQLEFSPLTCVHIANAMVRTIEEDELGEVETILDMEYLDRLNMGDRISEWKQVVENTLTCEKEPV